MARSFNRDVDDDRIDETWTEDEIGWYLMGPFDGKIPGLVRRVRRILDVSQRGLAATSRGLAVGRRPVGDGPGESSRLCAARPAEDGGAHGGDP